MFDHSPNHQSSLLPAKQVKTFFDELAVRYQGHKIRVALGEDALRDPDSLALASLESLELTHSFHKEELIIKTRGADAITFRVIMVWVTRDEDGRIVTVEVADNKNNKLVLYFQPQ